MNEGQPLPDPNSISLFTSLGAADNPALENDEARSLKVNSLHAQTSPPEKAHSDYQSIEAKGISYSNYQVKKNSELSKRRDLVGRFEKLKATQGIFYNIPQFKNATLNQLSLFIRRLRKNADLASFMSAEMVDQIFAGETDSVTAKITRHGSDKTEQVICINEIFGMLPEDEPRLGRLRKSILRDGETTDEENTDYEEDDVWGGKDELSAELHQLLEQRMEFELVDARIAKLQNELDSRRTMAAGELEQVLQDQFVFEPPPTTGEPEQDSQSSARCRALLHSAKRALVRHHLDSGPRQRDTLRAIIPHKRCAPADYAHVDESIHGQLSLQTSISLDSQVMKYVHQVDFIPTEIETRRYKMAQLISSRENGNEFSRGFCNLEEDHREGPIDERLDSPASQSFIKLSLPLCKKLLKRSLQKRDNAYEADIFESDSDTMDADFEHHPSRTGPSKNKRRRMTDAGTIGGRFGTSKPVKMEHRRTSHAAEFGASAFDFDSQLLDVGLLLPTIQKVESVEIAIPSFRKSDGLADLAPDSGCLCRADQWDDIERLHADLELQERSQRFRPPAGCSSRKSTLTMNTGAEDASVH